ncbi:uncharacterized protein LOC123314914 [Coccinella septempunctata]|uniref:uncharacterized protein LOC123314914 n=1 Tax=Coccinella septempunctata TaxID=41139 RepID=UPI001D0613A6|nr:uncharacterized protein LOC123314914 [Coccinella septempunctata]
MLRTRSYSICKDIILSIIKENSTKMTVLLIYIKENINYEYKILKIDDINILDVDIKTENGENLKLSSIYRSPDTSVASFNMEISEYLHNINLNMKHIIAGDMNINLLDHDSFVEEYKNILSSYGFVSMINRPTRPDSGTCLDHFFVRGFNPEGDDAGADAGVLQYLVTDHYPVILGLDMMMKYKNDSNRKKKKYINYCMLKEKLKAESWLAVYEQNEVNEIADSFVGLLAQHIEECTSEVTFKKRERIRKGWITPAILKLL